MIIPLNAELNPICHLLALLGARPILHVSRVRVKHSCARARRLFHQPLNAADVLFRTVTAGHQNRHSVSILCTEASQVIDRSVCLSQLTFQPQLDHRHN
jgi:hypothetical protein